MAKSPVYGMDRNRKHRGIHKAANHGAAGNVKMHGKKTKLMSCWCCVCLDFREKIRYNEDTKLIRKYLRGEQDDGPGMV
jgi:hypothetical protein